MELFFPLSLRTCCRLTVWFKLDCNSSEMICFLIDLFVPVEMAAALLCPLRTRLPALRAGRIGKHLLTPLVFLKVFSYAGKLTCFPQIKHWPVFQTAKFVHWITWCVLFIKEREWWSTVGGGYDVACGAIITGPMWARVIHSSVSWVKIGCLISPEIAALVYNLWGQYTRQCSIQNTAIASSCVCV